MAKITASRKKELQEPDEFLSVSQRVWVWLHENRDRAAMAAGGIAAVVLIAVGAKSYVERSREQRAADVSAAVARYVEAGSKPAPAELRDELASLAARHTGTVPGAVARFFQAGALGAVGDVEQARRILGELSARSGAGDIGVQARVSLAYFELAGGKTDAALAAFQELLKIEGTAVPRAQILTEIAAIHEKKGQTAEARRVYEDLIANHPDGPWVAEAKQRLKMLTERGTPAA